MMCRYKIDSEVQQAGKEKTYAETEEAEAEQRTIAQHAP